jgi:hypothetical protein
MGHRRPKRLAILTTLENLSLNAGRWRCKRPFIERE